MKKYILYGLLVLAIFGAGFLWSKERGDKRVLKERLKNEAEKVALLTGQIADIVAQREKVEKALEKFQADSTAREKWFQGQIAKVSTATPAQLVDQGSQIVNATDITTDGKIVTMGVETYRQFVTIAVDWQEYKNVREPGWKTEKGLFQDQIAGFKQERLLDAQKDAALNASIADLKKFISSGKVTSFLDKVLWAGAGFGLGMLVHGITK